MAINFPNAPTLNQVYTYNNQTWKWNSYAWDLTSSGQSNSGATGGGTDQVFFENNQTVTTSYTISANRNAVTAGPITIANGATVTVPTGAVWTVV
jgi:hypothetical protein